MLKKGVVSEKYFRYSTTVLHTNRTTLVWGPPYSPRGDVENETLLGPHTNRILLV